jgi:2-amino-4-hydroxy-6-hydroxymethyldihydropteridine diphosphokinase
MEIGLSLGSNLGKRLLQLQKAKEEILALNGVAFVAQSPVYETEPLNVLPADRSKLFLNAVLIIDTLLEIPQVLVELKRIEKALGRPQKQEPNSPRTIDVDIIYAGNLKVRRHGITVPHPSWSERRFVVKPLNDVRPDLIVPGEKDTVAQILRKLSDKHQVKLFAKEW